VAVDDDSKIAYRLDHQTRTVEFVFFGQCEFSIGMTPSVVRRCQDLFGEVSAQLGSPDQVQKDG
jgi:hypothetical protein